MVQTPPNLSSMEDAKRRQKARKQGRKKEVSRTAPAGSSKQQPTDDTHDVNATSSAFSFPLISPEGWAELAQAQERPQKQPKRDDKSQAAPAISLEQQYNNAMRESDDFISALLTTLAKPSSKAKGKGRLEKKEKARADPAVASKPVTTKPPSVDPLVMEAKKRVISEEIDEQRKKSKQSEESPSPMHRLADAIKDRLPAEVQEKIYSYCLVAPGPIEAKVSNYKLRHATYDALSSREGCKVSDLEWELKRAVYILIFANWAPDSAAAHVFLLRNNVLFVGSKREVNELVLKVDMLKKEAPKDFQPFVYGLWVEVPLDVPWKPRRQKRRKRVCDMYQLGYGSSEDEDLLWLPPPRQAEPGPSREMSHRPFVFPSHPRGEAEDFKEDDNRGRIGLRAYRILKPLLQLPLKLQRLNITIQESLAEGAEKITIYGGINCISPGLPLIAGVIAKLKDRFDPKTPCSVPGSLKSSRPIISGKEEEMMEEINDDIQALEKNANDSEDGGTIIADFEDSSTDEEAYGPIQEALSWDDWEQAENKGTKSESEESESGSKHVGIRSTRTFRVARRFFDDSQDAGMEFEEEHEVDENDIGWLWATLSDEQVTRMETYKPISSKQAKRIQTRIGNLTMCIRWLRSNPEIDRGWMRAQTLKVLKSLGRSGTAAQKIERMEADRANLKKQLEDRKIRERYKVHKLATDPEWEQKADALTKQRSKYVVPEQSSEASEESEDSEEPYLSEPADSDSDYGFDVFADPYYDDIPLFTQEEEERLRREQGWGQTEDEWSDTSSEF